MIYKIYQVDTAKANEIAFRPYKEIEQEKVYRENYYLAYSSATFSSDYRCSLSSLRSIFTSDDTYYAYRKLNVSDVIVLEGFPDGPKAFYCNSLQWDDKTAWEEIDYEYFYSGLPSRKVSKTNNGKPDYLTTEKELIKKLSDIYNEFSSKLYSQHPNELSDFADGIHKCQYVLAMRMAREHYPDLFPYKLDKN